MRSRCSLLVLVVVGALLASSGCAILKPTPRVTYTNSSQYKPQAATSPADVKVYQLDDATLELPEGVTLNPKATYTDQKVQLEAEFPTAEAPHVMVGKFNVRQAQNFERKQLIDALVKRAAEDGANAIFVDFKKSNVTAMGVHLSGAAAAAVEAKPAEELLDEEASHPTEKEYTEVLTTETRKLQAYEPLELDAKRGTCYWLTFALAEDAALSSHARKSLGFDFTSVDYDIDHRAGLPTIEEKVETSGQLERSARSGSISIGCPQKSGPLEVDLQAKWGSAGNKDRLHDLGKGEIVFRVHTRSITEAELKERKKESEKRWKEAEERRNKENRRICRKCANKLVLCGDKDPRFCDPYTSCISRSHGRLNVCLEGL